MTRRDVAAGHPLMTPDRAEASGDGGVRRHRQHVGDDGQVRRRLGEYSAFERGFFVV